MTEKEILQLIERHELNDENCLSNYLLSQLKNNTIDTTVLSRIIELSNSERENHSAYYTNPFIIQEIINYLPDFLEKSQLHICEPSVGAGNFLPFLFEKYKHIPKVKFTLIDINPKTLEWVKLIYNQQRLPENIELEFICNDFMLYQPERKFDLIIGNPPFTKLKRTDLSLFDIENYSQNVKNLSAFFLEKSLQCADVISLIMPKNLLNTPEYKETREKLTNNKIQSILDFGELGFKGVLVETINIICNLKENNQRNIDVCSLPKKLKLIQKANYIFDSALPYWVIYRDQDFDKVFKKLKFNQFTVFRDRQITNENLSLVKKHSEQVRVLKSRNISDLGDKIIDIENYDAYIEQTKLMKLSVAKYFDREDVYLTPNMTYKPRLMRKQKGYIMNGSVAVLIPKFSYHLSDDELKYYASSEFRHFYQIARNYQTRSLNIDANSVFWFGLKNREIK
uniref:Eco57I restriction-modification methylase domain-containing protein n=1 Tax=Gilliamella sp. ESL0232 TaxID=2705037 RepID=UPI000ADEC155|nr:MULTISPECIES: Eco57I restriction-modification methylase domain-containing protein [Gilliamella]